MDLSKVARAIHLSGGAYDEEPDGVTRIAAGPGGHVTADLHVYDASVWVAFCGTNDVRDALGNLELCAVDVAGAKGARVHRGFQAMADAIVPALRALLEREARPHVVLTGHSLGGALAIVSAPALKADDAPWSSLEVVAVAAPRVGNEAYARHHGALGIPTLSIANGLDPVCHQPFWGSYHRPGRLLWMWGNMARWYDRDLGTATRLLCLPTCIRTGDHAVNAYVRGLHRVMSRAVRSDAPLRLAAA